MKKKIGRARQETQLPATVADHEAALLSDLRNLIQSARQRIAGEEAPIGLILCSAADTEQVELLELDAKSIRVAEYLTELPPLPLLRARLQQAITHARESADRQKLDEEDQQ